MSLTTTDADAAHAELRARGVDVDDDVMRMGDYVPPMFTFRDAEGTTVRALLSDRPDPRRRARARTVP